MRRSFDSLYSLRTTSLWDVSDAILKLLTMLFEGGGPPNGGSEGVPRHRHDTPPVTPATIPRILPSQPSAPIVISSHRSRRSIKPHSSLVGRGLAPAGALAAQGHTKRRIYRKSLAICGGGGKPPPYGDIIDPQRSRPDRSDHRIRPRPDRIRGFSSNDLYFASGCPIMIPSHFDTKASPAWIQTGAS